MVARGGNYPDTGGGGVYKLTCIFHEGGCVCHVFAKRINLIARPWAIVAQGLFIPIQFQKECAVTA
jgi:hypothetical protein